MTRRLELRQFTPAPEALERDMYAALQDRLTAAGFEHYEVSAFARRDGVQGSGFGVQGEDTVNEQPSVNSTLNPEPHSPNPSPFRCSHNLTYWRNGTWRGIGPSAASHLAGRRWKNAPRLGDYLAASPHPPIVDDETPTPSQRVGETLMLGLRLREGVPLSWLTAALNPGHPHHPDPPHHHDHPHHITPTHPTTPPKPTDSVRGLPPRADTEAAARARRTRIDHFVELGLLERTPTHLRLTQAGLFVADAILADLI